MKVVVSCNLAHQGHVLSDPPSRATMETCVLQLQDQNCGIAFQLTCDKLTLAFYDLNSYRGNKDIFVWMLRSRHIVTNC